MLSYDFSSISTSFTEPTQGPLSEDPARLWKKLSIEEVSRNAENARKKRSFEAFSETCDNCGPWSLEYLQATGTGQTHTTQNEAALVASCHSWLPSSTESSQAIDEPQCTYKRGTPHSQEPWSSGNYIFARSPAQIPAVSMEQVEEIPAFSLPEIPFSSTHATTPARTITVIHSPMPVAPRSANLTSDAHTYKKVDI
jgi:hypothetical protein